MKPKSYKALSHFPAEYKASEKEKIMHECCTLWSRGNRSTWRKPATVPLCPPQISHDLTWAQTWTAIVGNQWPTAWAVARPIYHLLCSLYINVPINLPPPSFSCYWPFECKKYSFGIGLYWQAKNSFCQSNFFKRRCILAKGQEPHQHSTLFFTCYLSLDPPRQV
jgi:hypothetical protein